MRREIEGKAYDTTTATVIATHTSDSTHIHRAVSLYQSPTGDYFLVEEREAHGVDGAILTPCTAAMARDWLLGHDLTDRAPQLFE